MVMWGHSTSRCPCCPTAATGTCEVAQPAAAKVPTLAPPRQKPTPASAISRPTTAGPGGLRHRGGGSRTGCRAAVDRLARCPAALKGSPTRKRGQCVAPTSLARWISIDRGRGPQGAGRLRPSAVPPRGGAVSAPTPSRRAPPAPPAPRRAGPRQNKPGRRRAGRPPTRNSSGYANSRNGPRRLAFRRDVRIAPRESLGDARPAAGPTCQGTRQGTRRA